MVSVKKGNAFQLREHLHRKALEGVTGDPFKSCFMSFLGLTQARCLHFAFESLSLYQKCAISGLHVIDESVSKSDLSRLLGQASRIDSTPMPWVSDLIGVMSIKWLVEKEDDDQIHTLFQTWKGRFLPQQAESNRLNVFEEDIARYILEPEASIFSTSTIRLFLHYQGIRRIVEQQERQALIQTFMKEFQEHGTGVSSVPSAVLLSLMIYVFDKANQDIALVPPNGWSLDDLLVFLERIPVGLMRWTWEEDKGRTRNSDPVKWPIENEYHVQNLLYALLAPIFDDIADEIYLQQVGQKTPRADLYLPSVHTIIEVKYRKDVKKSFQNLIGEIAEDVSLYRADSKYAEDERIICFLWDHTRATQEHAKFKEGIMKIQGADGCVVVSSPSNMD